MEPLENIASAESVKAKDAPVNYSEASKSYEGLVMLENQAYKGGTSIKYWM